MASRPVVRIPGASSGIRAVTVPPLPDAGQWTAFEAARQSMLPNFGQTHAATRYREAARPGSPKP